MIKEGAKKILACRGNGYSEEDFNSAIEVAFNCIPPLPFNIDEAAEEYANYNSRRWHEDGDVYYDYSKIVDAFKAGVKWIEEQGVDAKCVGSCNPISESPDIRLHSITLFYEEHKDTPYVIRGDRLKVILLK